MTYPPSTACDQQSTRDMFRTALAWTFLLACGPTNASSVHDTTVGTTLASDIDIPADVGCECIRPGEPEVEAYDSDSVVGGRAARSSSSAPTSRRSSRSARRAAWSSTSPPSTVPWSCSARGLRAPCTSTNPKTVTSPAREASSGSAATGRASRGPGTGWTWGGASTELAVVTLRDPAYFADCQALQDPYDRFQCLKDWSQGPSLTVCDGPINYEP